jgi:hypothetical protein
MLRLLFVYLIATLISCSEKNQTSEDKIELVKQYNYRIKIDEWNGFSAYRSTFILNNQCINYLDCDEHYPKGAKPLTLYKISYKQVPDSQNKNRRIFLPTDTTEAVLSKQQSDRLFMLTKSFLKSVDFNDYDTAGNGTITKPYVTDDSQAKIELSYGGQSLTAYISSISDPNIGTRQLDTLLKFVYGFMPTK